MARVPLRIGRGRFGEFVARDRLHQFHRRCAHARAGGTRAPARGSLATRRVASVVLNALALPRTAEMTDVWILLSSDPN